MFDFFKALFKPVPPSSVTAKERLRLVLLSDHISLSPEIIESLKADLLEVIARYVVIDPAQADVTFEQRDHDLAMLASVPITAIRDSRPPVAPVAPAGAVRADVAPESVPAISQLSEETASAGPSAAAESSAVATAGAGPRSVNGKPPRRRRRRKSAIAGAASAKAAPPAHGTGGSGEPIAVNARHAEQRSNSAQA